MKEALRFLAEDALLSTLLGSALENAVSGVTVAAAATAVSFLEAGVFCVFTILPFLSLLSDVLCSVISLLSFVSATGVTSRALPLLFPLVTLEDFCLVYVSF